MAKPILLAVPDAAPPSSPSHIPPIQRQSSPPNSFRRRSSRPRSSPSAATPSSALLSALAGIVASSPIVAASPAPPHFLCPSLAQPPPPSRTIQRRSISQPSSKSRRSAERSRSDRVLPYKFEPGEDGFWRKVETYTLYGSTVSSVSALCHVSPSLFVLCIGRFVFEELSGSCRHRNRG